MIVKLRDTIHKSPLWLIVLSAVVIGVVSFLISYAFFRRDTSVPKSPVTITEITIHNRVVGIDGPALRQGDVLKASYTRCNSNGIVIAQAFRVWETVRPTGDSVPDGDFSTPIPHGCITPELVIPMPTDVVSKAKELNAIGVEITYWRLAGSITVPGKTPVGFLSEPFKVVP